MPKTVLSGTAISAMKTVSQIAVSACGSVSASMTGAMPSSNVRHSTIVTGKMTIRLR